MNFEFLKKLTEFNKLYDYCQEADEFMVTRPSISAAAARRAVEYVVKFIYNSIIGSGESVRTIYEMMADYRFVDYIDDNYIMNCLHYIRKMGNIAVHEGDITVKESEGIVEDLQFVVGELMILLDVIDDYPTFVKPSSAVVNETPATYEPEPQVQIFKEKKVEVPGEIIAKYGQRMRETRFNVRAGRDEEENRRLFLYASLREANYPVVSKDNQAMPCSAGINMILDDGESIDYIIYGRDNKPLAIVEYSTTKDNLIAGRMRGIQKANLLEKKYGYKPVVYYTNGYFTYCIDQLGYKPRRVFQFHTIEELELLKLRGTMRQDITDPVIDDAITNREYQKNAIRAACNAFASKRRSSLLVMATGTGKTRVSISLVDILMKANWAKNVLFLADRTSLVRQAHKNFNKLLPSVTTSIYTGGGDDRDSNARIIFSTYQTMIGLINDDTREFGIGRFDLIVIDEAHRSIFSKYGALFNYFDALMIGLTATPRADIGKNSYQVFDMKNNEPDFAYDLEEAVNDGFLVGYSILDRTTEKLRHKIKYDDLNDEEKENYEQAFAATPSDDYSGSEVAPSSRYVVNLGTLDAMLNDLMKSGLHVDGGNMIGKTIIFAKNHFEATKIVERFHKIYDYLGKDFCALIDSQVDNPQNLIDNFGERGKMPQVVVSVDMLDTGIDVPDVLNLVFFKEVHSKIKFMQMIGRGTRLSPDVYGPGMDKQGFYIIDYYDNFNFFSGSVSGWGNSSDKRFNNWDKGGSWYVGSVSERVYQLKLNILYYLQQLSDAAKSPFELKYEQEIREMFINETRALNTDDISVQYNMAYVSKYRTAENWNNLTSEAAEEIGSKILPLLHSIPEHKKIIGLDRMFYTIEWRYYESFGLGGSWSPIRYISYIQYGFGKDVYQAISARMNELKKVKTIPAVMAKEKLIDDLSDAKSYLLNGFSIERTERIRKDIRDLMIYAPDDKIYYTLDIDDKVIVDKVGGDDPVNKTYAERVQEYIKSNPTELAKIRNLDELTAEEKQNLEDQFKVKLGTEAEYSAWANNLPLLVQLRLQVGIADEAIDTKFGAFMNEQVLNEQQLAYMNQIISYARENGDITFMHLQQVSPFCDIDIMELFGMNIGHVKSLINGLHRPVVMEGN